MRDLHVKEMQPSRPDCHKWLNKKVTACGRKARFILTGWMKKSSRRRYFEPAHAWYDSLKTKGAWRIGMIPAPGDVVLPISS
jgi:hypothetical protein